MPTKSESDKKYYLENKKRILARNKKYRDNRLKEIKVKKADYYQKNKSKILVNVLDWRRRNRERYVLTRRKRKICRWRNDPSFRTKEFFRKKISDILSGRINKDYSWLIGCDNKKFRTHVEYKFKKKMTWKNYGAWQIDHIKPLCSYDVLNKKDLIKAFNYKNLQPLWAEENQQKGIK